MQGSALHEESVAGVVAAGLDGAAEDVYVVNPTTDTIRALIEELGGRQSPPTVKLLADEDQLKDLVEDFLIASSIADLLAEDTLEIRTLQTPPRNFLFVSAAEVVSVVDAGDAVAGLTTDESDFVAAADDHYADAWAEATEFSLRTPPRTAVTETLADEIGRDTEADFRAILDSMSSARGNGQGLDEVTVSLLVAARNGVLLYDISKWGEDVGLASKATFSRTKTRLEDKGLIDTDKVPIDVGRPRLRLKLGDDELADLPPAEMARRAHEILTAEA